MISLCWQAANKVTNVTDSNCSRKSQMQQTDGQWNGTAVRETNYIATLQIKQKKEELLTSYT